MKNFLIIALIVGLVYWYKKHPVAEAKEIQEPELKSAWLLNSLRSEAQSTSSGTSGTSGSGMADSSDSSGSTSGGGGSGSGDVGMGGGGNPTGDSAAFKNKTKQSSCFK